VPIVTLTALCATRWKEGFWGNLISFGNVSFSILISVGWWEDIACLLALRFSGWVFYADTIAIWAIFLLSLLILETLTRLLSRVKVKFADAVEKAGSGLMIFLLFLVLYSFFRFAEMLSPVGENIDVPPQIANAAAPIDQMEKPGDPLLIPIFRLLSAGNLASFTTPTQFDYEGTFTRNHLMRRQVIMHRAKYSSVSTPSKTNPPTRRLREETHEAVKPKVKINNEAEPASPEEKKESE
jgi:hypothetical protein